VGDNFLLTITASVCLRQEALNVLTDYVLDVTVPFVTTLTVHSTFWRYRMRMEGEISTHFISNLVY